MRVRDSESRLTTRPGAERSTGTVSIPDFLVCVASPDLRLRAFRTLEAAGRTAAGNSGLLRLFPDDSDVSVAPSARLRFPNFH